MSRAVVNDERCAAHVLHPSPLSAKERGLGDEVPYTTAAIKPS